MCLILEKDSPVKLAKNDIICYKLLIKNAGKYYTPYRDYRIIIGQTYMSKLELFQRDTYDKIEDGLHSYANLSDVSELYEASSYYIVKCCIPKGSCYYQGIFNSKDSYASDCLRYDEII